MAVAKKAQTFAGALFRCSDADMIEFADAQAVDGETTATDVAGELPKRVIHGFVLVGNAEHSDSVFVGSTDKPNRAA